LLSTAGSRPLSPASPAGSCHSVCVCVKMISKSIG
jgi:hypothetical protein